MEKIMQVLLELVRRARWSSEFEHGEIHNLLHEGEKELAALLGTESSVIPPPAADMPAPAPPAMPGGELDYDKLAKALIKASAEATQPAPDVAPEAPPAAPAAPASAAPQAVVPPDAGAAPAAPAAPPVGAPPAQVGADGVPLMPEGGVTAEPGWVPPSPVDIPLAGVPAVPAPPAPPAAP